MVVRFLVAVEIVAVAMTIRTGATVHRQTSSMAARMQHKLVMHDTNETFCTNATTLKTGTLNPKLVML